MIKDIPTTVLSNFYGFVEYLAELSGATLEKRGNLTWYNKGLSYGMYQYAVTDELVEDDVAAMLRSFGDAPFFFCTGSTDSDLMLQKKGLKSYGGLVGMFYDLKQDLPQPATAVAFEMRAIANQGDYLAYAKVMADAAGADPSIGKQFFNDYQKYLNSPFVGLIAYVSDKPVGCVMLLKTEKPSAGIYYLWVLPEYRNKGIGSALSSRCLAIAKDLGYEQVVIQCMTTSASLHERIGFQPVCQLGLYGK